LQRTKLQPLFFEVWNKWLVECFYHYYETRVKRWRGFRLQAVDGSKAYLINKKEVIEYFGTQEAVPQWISRNGIDILYKGFGTVLYNYASSTFSDALNTVTPPASGAKGFTPAYSIWDFNASLKTNSFLTVRVGINNIFDKQYYTKRPTFYPGSGIWPATEETLM